MPLRDTRGEARPDRAAEHQARREQIEQLRRKEEILHARVEALEGALGGRRRGPRTVRGSAVPDREPKRHGRVERESNPYFQQFLMLLGILITVLLWVCLAARG